MILRKAALRTGRVKYVLESSMSRRNSSGASVVPKDGQKPFYVTSPIFYVNAVPHIGHLYSTVIADIFARWERMRNPFRQILYTTGTDEHGLKVQQAAKDAGMSPLELCDTLSQSFKDLSSASDLASTTFIRTTEKRHAEAVDEIWRRLMQRGYIYKGVHSGWYAISDEAFYTSSQVEKVEDPNTGSVVHRSTETGKEVVWTEEENYKFRLSAFREALKEWIKQSSPIKPRKRQDEILKFLSESSEQDLSISRPRTRVGWGLPVPNDQKQTIYVWLDALTSYLTAIGFPWNAESDMRNCGWPANTHIIGKDILRFHAVYFPAFLMALDLPLPQSILCHAHWTMNKQKMSKSIGNVVDPFQVMAKYGVDTVRWYLAKVGGHFVDDVDWSTYQLEAINDRDLQGLGNLYRRVHTASMCSELHYALPSNISTHPLDQEMCQSLTSASKDVTDAMKALAVSRAIEAIIERVDLTNRYLTQTAPWKEQDEMRKGQIVALTRESLRICTILLQPFIPNKSSQLLDWLLVPSDKRSLIWASFGAMQSVGGVPARPDQRLFESLQ